MKYKKLGMPYMGSKRKLAGRIVDLIISENPNVKYIYDLFGGGGAISFEFLQREQIEKVYYNELNKGVCELLKDIQKNGVTEKYYRWIDRETFHKHKNDNDWFGGLVKVIWSFGNKQDSYMFSKENENMKKPLHELAVNKDVNAISDFKKITGITIPIELIEYNTIYDRRINLMRFIKSKLGHQQLQQLERLQQLEQLQRLQQLEQLEQLQRLQRLEQLNISCESFENVKIETPINETIIYLDPPYIDTAKYQQSIDYDVLYDYMSSSKYKIYMSSYNAPFDCIASYEHRCTLSSSNTSKKTCENLYVNR
ncbi:MAG: hypothetical protein EOM76_09770 [Sphingobacteriia bacterium]|nr:hypothetical protein [Sphingobacteriia bacterium]